MNDQSMAILSELDKYLLAFTIQSSSSKIMFFAHSLDLDILCNVNDHHFQ